MTTQVNQPGKRKLVYEEVLGGKITSSQVGHIICFAQRHHIGDFDLVKRIAAGTMTLGEVEADHVAWRATRKRRCEKLVHLRSYAARHGLGKRRLVRLIRIGEVTLGQIRADHRALRQVTKAETKGGS